MSIMFDKYKFLELFDTEIVVDEEIESKRYTLKQMDFILNLYISPYDEYSSLTLENKHFKYLIFDIAIYNLHKIESVIDKYTFLHFYTNEKNEPVLILMLKPNIALQTTINKNYLASKSRSSK